MRDINEIDLRLIDTTILMVFLGIMRHRQATAVAREMGLTQPAVSHALKRLRAIYGDPLFLRRAHGLEPTAFARDLEPKIRRIVWLISQTLSDTEHFDPEETAINLRIGAFDHEFATILPDLVARLREVSPNVGIHMFSLSNQDALDALVEGQIDMAVGYFEFPTRTTTTFVADRLCVEEYVMAVRRNHPMLASGVSLAAFTSADHLLVSPSGPHRTLVDHALQLRGLSRNIQTTVPSLFAALSIVERSDLVVTLPRRVAERNSDRFNLTWRPFPIEVGTFDWHIVRHSRDAHSAIHTWIVGQIVGLMANPAL